MSRPSAAGSGLSDLSGVGLSLAFVVIWASGFVVARYAAPHADPFTFLSVRFAITAVIFVALVPLAGAPWPRRKETWAAALISGVLIHGLYLGGMFWAMWHDLPAGIAALIGGLQPIVTATLVGPFLGERIRPAHWLGLSIGLASVGLVVAPTLGQIDGIPCRPSSSPWARCLRSRWARFGRNVRSARSISGSAAPSSSWAPCS